MARLLFTLPRFHTNLWFAVRAMRAAGHDLCFLVNESAKSEDHSHLTPVVMGRHPSRSEVARAIADFAPDLVVVRNAWALSRRAARVARQSDIPCLLYNLLPYLGKTSLLRQAELRWKGLPVQRITPVRGLGPDRPADPFARYLPWPVGRFDAPDPWPREPGKLNVLCVGKLGLARKNQPLLLDAIDKAGLQDRVNVLLVGSTPRKTSAQASHAAQLADLTTAPWVRMIAGLPFRDMANVYAGADVVVLPSTGEPLGVAPIEGMAYGAIPIISSESGSAGYLTHGENGFVVDIRRPGSLADALRAVLPDAPRAAISAAARRTAETELGEAAFLDRLHAILQGEGVSVG
ncbi:glycosyltransferase family 4 protein [Thalassococcus sp. CAU 1522]|uniref:Glycosyltransferase family 4 protein n=1 Tax=Thalassococcus arenae TaxID=2851652 RepID=A0ABS6N5L0_9RHOB|nr:glycosyltransferase family 4 protein [Thalassococcus arenae]MBV2359305.1 glycosyltransferase family 4 protein [Thalassococcus arenae]